MKNPLDCELLVSIRSWGYFSGKNKNLKAPSRHWNRHYSEVESTWKGKALLAPICRIWETQIDGTDSMTICWTISTLLERNTVADKVTNIDHWYCTRMNPQLMQMSCKLIVERYSKLRDGRYKKEFVMWAIKGQSSVVGADWWHSGWLSEAIDGGWTWPSSLFI